VLIALPPRRRHLGSKSHWMHGALPELKDPLCADPAAQASRPGRAVEANADTTCRGEPGYYGSMARKPPNVSWQEQGFTQQQADLLDRIDFYGNNGWSRNSQAEALMPVLLSEAEQAGLSLVRVQEAMASIGYSDAALHQLDRWESRRTTGRFGR
jgi:hypothetical protein